jgi:hypothetical protein
MEANPPTRRRHELSVVLQRLGSVSPSAAQLPTIPRVRLITSVMHHFPVLFGRQIFTR